MNPKPSELRKALAAAAAVADTLLDWPCLDVVDGDACPARESRRTSDPDVARDPCEYDPANFCTHCRAFWYAHRAAATLCGIENSRRAYGSGATDATGGGHDSRN